MHTVCECESATSLGCDQLTGQCRCRQGVTGKSCDACEEGTDSVWPDCLKCNDTCYNLWNDSIFNLTEVVDTIVSTATTSNISSFNVSLEEFDRLCKIVDDIYTMLNKSNLSLTQLNRVDQLVVMVTEQVIPQLQAANVINTSISNINGSEMMLLEQLETIKKKLVTESNDLDELQLELMAANSSDLSNQIQSSLNRSLMAYKVMSNDVLQTIAMIRNNSRVYGAKLKTFLSIEVHIENLSSLVNSTTEFIARINSYLCGDIMLSNESDSNCSGGVFQASMTTASQVLTSIMKINELLSTAVNLKSQLNELLEMLEMSLRNLNTTNDYELPNKVMMLRDEMSSLNDRLLMKLNPSVLLLSESLVNQTLRLSLNTTPDEVCVSCVCALCMCCVCVLCVCTYIHI